MLRRKTIPLVSALAAILIVLAAGVVLLFGASNARRAAEARAARLEAENRDLRARLAQYAGGAPAGHRDSAVPSGAPRAASPSRLPEEAWDLEQARAVIELRDRLAAAASAAESLEARIRNLEAAVETAKNESSRMAASEAALRERLESTGRALEAAQNEAKGQSERIAQLEAASVRLREENRAVAVKAGQVPAWVKDLNDIERRREPLLASILRRYQDVTEQYRALAGRLDGQELGRIHNSISMAEEDLRQLAALNSQATRLRQRIAAAK